LFGFGSVGQTFFEGDREGDDEIAWIVFVDPGLYGFEVLILFSFVVFLG
jgi:hypothetical protein